MIRQAAATDAVHVAPLIFDAIGSGIAYSLTGAAEADEAISLISEAFAKKGNRLSFENAVVAVKQEIAVGFALFYHGSQTEKLDQPFVEQWVRRTGQVPVIVKEARDDEFYLDSLAVRYDCRGQGIGTSLLRAFEQAGEKRGYSRAALLVAEENAKARKLYVAMGYKPDGTLLVSGDPYVRMIKRLPVLV
ncbi:GNAT family N-acetyltransferase [Brevibacillus sp. TJ4]|uniref:GNAT family N-acetyltransferase n=1 Tax=Brevibacillus sp. TJ4 TaxID=3234853 RepID=UPI003BA086A3